MTMWLTVVAVTALAIFAVQRATAESSSAFEQLAELDRRARHHEKVSDRIVRAIARWEENRRGLHEEGELARSARSRLRRRAAQRLVTWEIIHRRISRRTILWSGGRSRDLRRLLRSPEIESLGAGSETFATIGRLRARMVDSAVHLRRRAGLAVELAQHRASKETAEAQKEDVVDSAKREGGLEGELDASQRELERSLEQLIDHQTGDDFHKRKGTLYPPVSEELAHGFGRRKQDDSLTYVRHTGLTYAVERGTDVRATADGLVVFAERMEGYGNLVIVGHGDDYHSLYAHLSEIDVAVGDEVARGERIGRSGATDSLSGPKLYFELRESAEPIDPEPWFVRRTSSGEESAEGSDSEE